MAPSPLELTLHLVSGERTRDADRFLFQARDYLRLREEGTSVRASFPWERALEDLSSLGSSRPSPNAAQRLGELLRAFLTPLGWPQDEQRLRQALDAGRPVRLTLRLEPAELCVLPWELLTLESTGQALSDLEGCTLCYERPGTLTHPAQPSPPPAGGRILFAWAGDVPAAAHQRALMDVCAHTGYRFDPRRDVLPHVSLASLEQALRDSEEPVAALHLLCHGAPSEPGAFGLAWNSSRMDGELDVVDAATLRAVLEPHAGRLRMVVLCACRGGDSGLPGNHLGSPAREMHRAGLSAVVASRLPLSKVGSVTFTRALYGALLERHTSLEQALAEARKALRLEGARMDGASLQLYARAGEGPDLRPFVFPPYCGLRPFEPGDRGRFFGREALRETLRQRVEAAAEGRAPAFQVMAGASGSGKSSLLRAGLLPELSPERWEITRVRAGEAGALEEVRSARASPGRHRLLVVDPLDEAFTRLAEGERVELLSALWEVSQAAERGTVVLATLRVDYLARCAEVRLGEGGPRLDAVLFEGGRLLLVPEMTADELREAIERPAWQQGLALEEGLTERLLQEVERQPGGLPLLAHTLERLWRMREGRWLKHSAYRALGGVAGALAQELDRLYLGLGEEERHQVRRLLVELVDVREGAVPFTCQRVERERVRPMGERARQAFDTALGRLVEGRVLVLGGGAEEGGEVYIEVAHEALLRHWGPLAEWIRADQERRRRRLELRAAADAWCDHPKSEHAEDYLLRGRRLEEALEFLLAHPDELDERVFPFINASREREDRLAREARKHQERLQDFARLIVADKLRREDPTSALLVLLEVREPEQHLAWTQAALEVLQQPIASAVLRGHQGPVRTAAISRDGTRVVTASRDGTARLWRADGTGLPGVFEGHSGEVLAAAFSPLGRRVVTASADRTARLWWLEAGSGSEVLVGHTGEVVAVAFSPDGERVVTASRDGTARVWRTDGMGVPVVLRGHEQGVVAAAFDATGERVVTASRDGTARVWHADGRGELAVLRHPGDVRAAVFSPDGERVATASVDGAVRVWRVEGQGEPILNQSDSGFVNAVAFSPDGGLVVSGHADGTVRLWRADGRGGMRLAGHTGEILTVAFSPDGMWVVTASRDGTARVRRTDGEGSPAELLGHGDEVLSARFSADGERVVTASRDGTARVWRWRAQPQALTLRRRAGPVQGLAFSPRGELLATAHADGTARVWRLDGTTDRVLLKGHGAELRMVAFSPEGKRVVTASVDGTARVWRTDGGSEPVVLHGHTGRVVTAAFSPDGERVVTASWDGTARVWRADGSGEAVVLHGHTEFLRSAAFSPEGERVVTASDDGTVRVWRADGSGRPVVLEGHLGRVVMAAFSPDGERVVTASEDGTAWVWRADGHGKPVVLKGHEQGVVSAEFSPDGARVLTVSQDKTVRVWSAEGVGEPVVLRGHAARFDPRGTRVVTASGDGAVRVWPVDGSGEPLVLTGHGAHVTAVAFSPEGDLLGIASNDGSARVWRLGVGALRERLRQMTSACLEIRQRQRYLGETLEEAREAHARCERARGRSPVTEP